MSGCQFSQVSIQKMMQISIFPTVIPRYATTNFFKLKKFSIPRFFGIFADLYDFVSNLKFVNSNQINLLVRIHMFKELFIVPWLSFFVYCNIFFIGCSFGANRRIYNNKFKTSNLLLMVNWTKQIYSVISCHIKSVNTKSTLILQNIIC